MTEQEFNDLIDRYQRNAITDAERINLERWFQNRGSADRFNQLSQAEKDQIRASLLYNIESKTKDGSLSEAEGRIIPLDAERSRSSGRLRIAASIAFLLILGYSSYKYYGYTQEQRYALTEVTAGDDIQKVMLSDGTILWLKPNASVSYPKEFRETGKRVISTRGEVLYEVAKDKSRPFEIHGRDMITTVVGTSFNIKETADKSEIFVLTGKVSVSYNGSQEKLDLLPMEKAVYSAAIKQVDKIDTRTVVAEKPEVYTRGTEYDMNFNDTRVGEFITRLEDKFDVTISVSNDAIKNCLLTADLTDQSLTSSLDKVTKVLNVEYKIEGTKITLTGTGCQ